MYFHGSGAWYLVQRLSAAVRAAMASPEQMAEIRAQLRVDMIAQYNILEKNLKDQYETEFKKLKDDKDAREKKDKEHCITSKKFFSDVPVYSGKVEDFEDWTFKLRNHLSDEPGYLELLLELDALTEIPKTEDLLKINETLKVKYPKIDMDRMNRQLYEALALKTSDKALVIIKNLYDQVDVNGCIAWFKLGFSHTTTTSQRMQGLASKVYGPKRMVKYADVTSAIEEWGNCGQAL